jgi:hypothetical protein
MAHLIACRLTARYHLATHSAANRPQWSRAMASTSWPPGRRHGATLTGADRAVVAAVAGMSVPPVACCRGRSWPRTGAYHGARHLVVVVYLSPLVFGGRRPLEQCVLVAAGWTAHTTTRRGASRSSLCCRSIKPNGGDVKRRPGRQRAICAGGNTGPDTGQAGARLGRARARNPSATVEHNNQPSLVLMRRPESPRSGAGSLWLASVACRGGGGAGKLRRRR